MALPTATVYGVITEGLPLVAESGRSGGDPSVLLVAGIGLVLASVHVLTPGSEVLESLPRPTMLSFGSGVSVAYVFVHLLPEVDEAKETVVRGEAALFPLDLPVYLVALGGFVTFYGLEHVVRSTRSRTSGEPDGDSSGVFWLHVGFFAGYNALLGYLLVERGSHGWVALVLFAVAIGLHLLVNDYGLREHHGDLYHRYGRWLLAGTVAAGTGLGLLVHVHEAVLGGLVAFLAGSIVLNVLKEELPDERDSRFAAFVAGVVLYAGLLLVV